MRKHGAAILLLTLPWLAGCGAGIDTSAIYIRGISPAADLRRGGNTITISGNGFTSGAAVNIGAASCGSVNVVSSEQLTCVTASSTGGNFDLEITNPDGGKGKAGGGFSFRSLVYAASSGADAIEGYWMNARDGSLTALPASPFTAGRFPRALAVHPTGPFLFAANYDSGDLVVDRIEPGTGNLTAIPGSPFASGGGATALLIHPNGNFVYVANFLDQTVAAFRFDATTAALTAVPGSPFALPFPPNALQVSPDGNFLYIATNTDQILLYAIQAVSGTLTAKTQSASPGAPVSLALTPTGQFLYVGNGAIDQLSLFSVDTITGTPTLQSQPDAGPVPGQLALSADGHLLFAASRSGDSVRTFLANASSGALTEVSGGPFPTAGGPRGLAVDPFGKFLYVVGITRAELAVHSILETGALSPARLINTGSASYSVVIVP